MKYQEFEALLNVMIATGERITPSLVIKKYNLKVSRQYIHECMNKYKIRNNVKSFGDTPKQIAFEILDGCRGEISLDELSRLSGIGRTSACNYRSGWREVMRNMK